MVRGYTYNIYKEAADYISSRIERTPDEAIILGTGCSRFAERIEREVVIPYSAIPNFPVTTNPSHKGNMIIGYVGDKYVLCLNGRFHYYEGYTMEELNIPVHVLHVLGIKTLIITNASGACNPDYKPGDVVIIKDHIKLYGGSPMRGENVPELGPRFFSVSDLYTKALRGKAKECALKTSLTVHEGVYMFFPGPQFETASEIRASRILGADIVGMSTVTEALTAAHSGMKLLGLAIVTNMGTGLVDNVDGSEVDDVAEKVSDAFCNYLEDIINTI